jgi:hypothetical protein
MPWTGRARSGRWPGWKQAQQAGALARRQSFPQPDHQEVAPDREETDRWVSLFAAG